MEPGSPLKRHFIDVEMPSVMSNQDGTIPDMIVSSQNPEISSQLSIISTSQMTGSRASSPVSSILDTIVIDVPPQPAYQVCIPIARSTVQDNPPPAKKIKLTPAEMGLVKTKKVHKEQQKTKEKAQKEEEKARREEEKRAKAEERRLKEEERKEAKRKLDEDREEKRKQREAEKLAKDEEKRKRDAEKKAVEEEKAKKAQSQLRLNSFFTKPKSGASREPPPLQERADPSGCNSTSSTDQPKDSPETPILTQEAPEAQFKKDFPSFYVHTNTTMAPINRFVPDDAKLDTVRLQIDQGLHSHDSKQPISFREVFHVRANKRRRITPVLSVKNLISQIHGTATRPIDLTKASSFHKTPEELLRRIPVKILKFAEDVRPPYIGTYTKIPTGKSTMKLFRKPFTRALPSTNYDYDSEAEWEEPEEGEDLDSEDDKEPEEDDGDDITDFLDDDEEGINSVKRRNIMGDVQPVYTQLHWEQSKKVKGPMMVLYGDTSLDMKAFRLELLLPEPTTLPIDPYSTSYWPSPKKSSPSKPAPSNSSTKSMAPPRMPLNPLLKTNATNIPAPHIIDLTSTKSPNSTPQAQPQNENFHILIPRQKVGIPAKPIPVELLAEFKKAIEGSDLTKVGLVEVLKKRFPSITKATIQDNLPLVAERVGERGAEKRWRLLS